jgi:MinD superfamily P-loop ATPase
MDNKMIAKELQRIAGIITSGSKPTPTVCNGCGYTDYLVPSRKLRAENSQRGYYCDRCSSFLKRQNRKKRLEETRYDQSS